MTRLKRSALLLTSVAMTTCLLISGCARKGSHPRDPFESHNRRVYRFNHKFDKRFIEPMSKRYRKHTPSMIRTGLANVFSNIDDITVTANDALQLSWKQARNDFTRFVMNTIFGLGGLFDVATDMGLPKHRNDLGITLAIWGDTNSPYTVVPFFGPSTMRDTVGFTYDNFLFTPYPYIRPLWLRFSVGAVRYFNTKHQYVLAKSVINNVALDPYSFERDAYLQHRQHLIAINRRLRLGKYADEIMKKEQAEQAKTSDGAVEWTDADFAFPENTAEKPANTETKTEVKKPRPAAEVVKPVPAKKPAPTSTQEDTSHPAATSAAEIEQQENKASNSLPNENDNAATSATDEPMEEINP